MIPPRWLFFLLLVVAFELLSDVLAKQFSLNGKILFAVLAILGFVVTNIFWLFSLRSGVGLGRGTVLFAVLTAIGGVIIALFIYHEKTSTYQLVGLTLGIAAIAFLSIE